MTAGRKLIVSFLTTTLFLFSTQPVMAQIMINAFSSNSETEWVKIYNSTGEIVDLTDWELVDKVGTAVTLSGCLIGNGFRQFNPSGHWLNNDGDIIFLKNALSETKDQIGYGSEGDLGIPTSDQSAGRNPDGSDNWEIFDPAKTPRNETCELSPTPTPTSVPSADSSDIELSEFMPNSESGNEWVEIRNISGEEVSIIDWKLKDDDGNSRTFSVIVAASSYYQYDLGSGFLNNDGDWFELRTNEDVQADEASFSYSNKGFSWIKSGDNWCEAENPTPGKTNSSCQTYSNEDPDPTPTPTPTPTSTPTPTPTPSPASELTGMELESSLGEVLGEESTGEGDGLSGISASESQEEKQGDKGRVLVILFLSLGMVFLFGAGYWVWYTQLRGNQLEKTEKEDSSPVD